MNGMHDMGGMDGFGKVEPEPNEPVFHAEWEARVLAMMLTMFYARAWNIDISVLTRGAAARCLPDQLLLQTMGARHGAGAARARAD